MLIGGLISVEVLVHDVVAVADADADADFDIVGVVLSPSDLSGKMGQHVRLVSSTRTVAHYL